MRDVIPYVKEKLVDDVSDGCTAWWNGFHNLSCDACRDHDLDYFLGAASGKSRLQADKDAACHVWASSFSPLLTWTQVAITRASVPVMFAGMRALGATRFGPGRKWGYGDVY